MKLFHAHRALAAGRVFKNALACSISARREREAKWEEGLICVREDAASHLVLIEATLES